MKMKPLGPRVLVRPIFTEQTTSLEGFVLPASEREDANKGEIVAVGDVKSVKVGDIVLFNTYGYDVTEVEKEEFYMIKEENLLAVIK